jgi:hypothetical protein
MLTIKNYDKLIRKNIGVWRIGKIEEIETAYLIQLYQFNRRNKIQINLERNPIGAPNGLYELWCWENDTPTAVPIRTLLTINDVKNIDKVLNGIEFLINKKRI